MSLDSLRREHERKLDALAKLQADKAKLSDKLAAEVKKETDALGVISRTKSASTIKSKQRTVDASRSSQARLQKEIAALDKKIAAATKTANQAKGKVESEEKREADKAAKAQKAAAEAASKRMASIEGSVSAAASRQRSLEARVSRLEDLPERITVLYLSASPIDADRLRVDEEAREIREALARSEHSNAIALETRWALRTMDLLTAINETKPTIIHFSGHGSEDGSLAFEDDYGNVKLISKEVMATVLATVADDIKLLVFNACFSEKQAEAVAGIIGAAIGMQDPVDDETAITFASQLYSSIGFGLSLRRSFDQAKARLVMEGCPGCDNPRLHLAPGVDANDLFFVGAAAI